MGELFSLEGKVVIVTGSGGLIGQELARSLAVHKARVVLADIDSEGLEDVHRSLQEGSHSVCSVNITDRTSLQSLRDYCLSKYGRIDGLINNAAINDKFEDPALAGEYSKFENYPIENWNASLKVNVTGVFLACQVIGKVMADQGSGSIVNVASTYGIVGPDQNLYKKEGEQLFFKSPAYPTTKGAVVNFSRYLAAYWGSKGVRVNCLAPGGVQNGQEDWFIQNYSARTPLGRMARANEYGGAVVYLMSDASSYMTGAIMSVDGGWTAV